MNAMEQMFERKPRSELGLLRMIVVGLFVLAVPIALITTTIRVAVSEKAFYDYAVQDYGAQQSSGIPNSELTRANGQVRDYLVSRGVPAARLETRSYGEESPKYDNSREETRRLNRRAALVVKVQ